MISANIGIASHRVAGAVRRWFMREFKNVKTYLDTNSLVSTVHGNKGRRPRPALTYPVVKEVVSFLKNYADCFEIPHPAPLHGRAGVPPVYLSAHEIKMFIHKLYLTACTESELQAVTYDTFWRIWAQCLPYVGIPSPQTDVCDTCETLRRRVARRRNDKLAACQNFKEHVHNAQRERDWYCKRTVLAKKELDETEDLRLSPQLSCSQCLRRVHKTFDFAQNVALPQSSRQKSPIFFKVMRKVQIFGVNCEALPRQVNYLIDVADSIGLDGKNTHSPNAAVSLIHHYFETFGYGEEECYIHADNCSAQNENRTVSACLVWRVMAGLQKKITLSFMITGHMQCLVDGCFGLLKQKFRRSDCYTKHQLEQVVNASAACNVAQPIRGSTLQWQEWDKFFSAHFKPVKGIRSIHHLEFDRSKLGVVTVKKSLGDEPVYVPILTTSLEAVRAAGVLPALPAAGLFNGWSARTRAHGTSEFPDELCPMPPRPSEAKPAGDD